MGIDLCRGSSRISPWSAVVSHIHNDIVSNVTLELSLMLVPLQIKHRYKFSEENGSLVNFPIFLLVFFDTLNWSRAGCIHLND